MINLKKFNSAMVAIILTTAVMITLSSFIKGGPTKPKTNKSAIVKTSGANAPVIYREYYNPGGGTGWSSTPPTECSGSGVVCMVGFNNAAAGFTIDQMCNDAASAWAATGNLANPSINSGNVTVHGKVCFIVEKAF